jgi:hypothetical protein
MKRKAVAVLLLALAAFGARAATLDLGKMSCGHYLATINRLARTNHMQSASGMFMWLYGYAARDSNVTIMTKEQFRRFAGELGRQCTRHSDTPLLVMVRKVGVK